MAGEERVSHAARRLRRKKMAQAVAKGEDPAQVAARFGVSLGTVETGCRESKITMPTLRRDAQRQRRRAIAEAVKKGMSTPDAARKWNVSLSTVYGACLEYNGHIPGGRRVQASTAFKILAALMHAPRGVTPAHIAREMGLSHQRVREVEKLAREAGILIKSLK